MALNKLSDFNNEKAIWSLLLASGYLKVVTVDESAYRNECMEEIEYELTLTNY